MCKIDESGDLIECTGAGQTGFDFLRAMAVVGTRAYIIGGTQNGVAMAQCDIGREGGLSDCVETSVTGLGSSYALTAQGSSLYVTSYLEPYVRRCEIRTDDSIDCIDANFPAAMADAVEDVQIVNSTAYILDYNLQQVSRCAVEPDGTFSACVDVGVAGIADAEALTISGNHMYIANAEQVLRCIIADDGSPEDCEDAGVQNLSYASKVAVNGSTVYITDGNETARVIRCTADSGGLLTGCTLVRDQPGYAYTMVLR